MHVEVALSGAVISVEALARFLRNLERLVPVTIGAASVQGMCAGVAITKASRPANSQANTQAAMPYAPANVARAVLPGTAPTHQTPYARKPQHTRKAVLVHTR